MQALTLWQRLSLLFAALLLACFGATAWLQMAQSTRQAQHVEQQLMRPLAARLAAEIGASTDGDSPPLPSVAARLAMVHPGVDLYLLDSQGRVQSRQPDGGPLQRNVVDLAPLRDFLAGRPLPILGDDPLHADRRKVFSVAPRAPAGQPAGYVYAVLQGAAHDQAAMETGGSAAARVALWSVGLVTPLGLVAGLLAFRLVTRPLSRLTAEIQALERTEAAQRIDQVRSAAEPRRRPRDEIAILGTAFRNLARSNAAHWQHLVRQDQQRREWLATVSHDLRTPLASMQGYLETVLGKSVALTEAEREQYLRTALSESQRLGRLAQGLLELARLELGTVRPAAETFSLVELAQDVLQKMALPAQARQQRLVPAFAPGRVVVHADIGMIERVLTNLLDNAIRHTPPGGQVTLRIAPEGERLRITVADHGPGIAQGLRTALAARELQRLPSRDGGGLGLAIVQQLLQLHGTDIDIRDGPGGGAVVGFTLPARD